MFCPGKVQPMQLTVPAPAAIKDISTKDFAAEVIKAEAPVLVDFWAPWCGPCKQLGPVLEKVVAAQNGKVKLVKMDVDQNQQLAAQLGIQSIPAVFAFWRGQPVDGFMGVQPESAIKAFVERLVKLSGGKLPGLDEVLAKADEALEAGDIETANEIFATVLEQDPVNATAYAGLIKVAIAAGQAGEAKAMLAEAPPEIANAKELAGVRAQLELADKPKGDASQLAELMATVTTQPDNHQARYDLALALYGAGQIEAAIDHLVESVKRDRKWNEEAARKQLVTIFEALGPMHEETIAGRRKLSSVLFR
jgi:putative thioredoxin